MYMDARNIFYKYIWPSYTMILLFKMVPKISQNKIIWRDLTGSKRNYTIYI